MPQPSQKRTLFPTLPPELRNLIYTHTLSTSDTPATAWTTTGLPFTTKTYTSAHTTTTIVPVHAGNRALLALRRYGFLEAEEYYQYLLFQAVKIKICITSTGHIGTFCHVHWSEKISISMRKLVCKHPWISKALDWQIVVVWNAKDISSMTRYSGRAGEIAYSMVSTILGFRTAEEKKGRGEKGTVEMRFHVPYAFASAKMVYGFDFGLEGFLFPGSVREGVGRLVKEVTMGVPILSRQSTSGNGMLGNGFRKVDKGTGKENEGLSVRNGMVVWSEEVQQRELVIRVVEVGNECWREVERKGEKEGRLEGLRGECVGVEGARGV